MVYAQQQVWVSDQGNNTYRNPVLHADYSDPDAIRVGEDYYMTASSFDAIPGLPILHSRDLVNWSLIGHALKRQPPFEHFEKTQHGNGVWAPSIRYHNSEFYIYYPDPDFGIYLTKSKNAIGPWSDPVLVEAGKGLIDPCPLWDDDGNNYLVYAYAGSRAGIKSVIAVKKLNAAGDKTVDAGVIVYDGHDLDPTIEGPKFYKRNGYYYIFAPGGGVATGWQTVLRSRNVYGPYERKVVMDQGTTSVNGPHQGAWVDTPLGENWFLHFQDKGAFGRVVHLQPLKWLNDWPVIGSDVDGDGKGEPVTVYQKPATSRKYAIAAPPESDEFNSHLLGLQWQWQANPKATWAFASSNGFLRLYASRVSDSITNYWEVPHVLLQKFPAEAFKVTTRITFKPNVKIENERTGLIVMGQSYAYVGLKSTKDGVKLVYVKCIHAASGASENEIVLADLGQHVVYLRVTVSADAKCAFSYSVDNKDYVSIESDFIAEAGRWIGAKVGLFCTRTQPTNDSGYADVDWFHVEK
nr:glycoside hydrolase 43 family protein [Pseudochryseolinea flava]